MAAELDSELEVQQCSNMYMFPLPFLYFPGLAITLTPPLLYMLSRLSQGYNT